MSSKTINLQKNLTVIGGSLAVSRITVGFAYNEKSREPQDAPSSCRFFDFIKEKKMADKGYYYLKLKENFFESDELKILESLENGYLYSNILLKLYLKALKNEGRLTFNDYIPYDTKMLATITGHNIDVVEKAIKIFQSMHLIEILDNGTIYMLDMQKMIGSISSEGVRKAEYREKIRLEKECGTMVGQCPSIISNSVSNSNYNSISYIEEKETEKEKEKRFAKPSLEEVQAYCKERNNNVDAERFINFYTSKGWKVGNQPMKDWKACVRTWERENRQKPKDNFIQHEYSKQDFDNLFDNLDNVKVV